MAVRGGCRQFETGGGVMRAGLVSVVAMGFLAAHVVAATHEANGAVGAKRGTRGKSLSSLCLRGDGNIVTADEEGKCLRVITPDDALVALWRLDFAPQAVSWRASDDTLLVAGAGRIALLDSSGKAVCSAPLPNAEIPAAKAAGMSAREREMFQRRCQEATSVSSSGDDVFVVARAYTGFSVYRYDKALQHPIAILAGLRGCCGQMDVMASGDTLYVAQNCDFEVGLYGRDGKKKGALKKPKGAAYFDGCCEPKNVCMGADGALYVAESGRCAVNRFSTDGKHLGEVGMIKDIGGCVRVTIAVSRDGLRVYMLDTEKNIVRVLQKKN